MERYRIRAFVDGERVEAESAAPSADQAMMVFCTSQQCEDLPVVVAMVQRGFFVDRDGETRLDFEDVTASLSMKWARSTLDEARNFGQSPRAHIGQSRGRGPGLHK